MDFQLPNQDLLDKSLGFYHDLIGFDNMGISRTFRMGMVSAGGYHHHIGFNTWLGERAPSSSPDALGMRYFTVNLPASDLGQVEARVHGAGLAIERTDEHLTVRDPSEISLVFQAS